MPDQTHSDSKLGPGRLVLVVGPSGAGKDTLLDALKKDLGTPEGIHFARRIITRDADTNAEDHDSLTHDAFNALKASGEFALCWEAHGLGYVIPKTCDTLISSGETVIANGSRRALGQAFDKYQHVVVLLITAPVDVLAERLAMRGRETREEIRARLEHANLDITGFDNIIRVSNTGTVQDGVRQIRKALDI